VSVTVRERHSLGAGGGGGREQYGGRIKEKDAEGG